MTLAIPGPIFGNRAHVRTVQRAGKLGLVNRSRATSEVHLFRRIGKRGNKIESLGVLVERAKYADDFKWKEQAEETARTYMMRRFEVRLEQAMATGR